jgi:hypothetical protein
VPTELGSYTVKVICAESMNYLEKIVVANFRITKPNYDMSGVSFNNKTVTYNGEEHTITITGELPEGVSVSYSANAVQINAGVYVITAYFTGDTENYNTIPEKTAILTVERAENELEIEAHDIVYNQAIDISVITNTANATIRYFYKKQGEDDIYFSDIAPRALGNYVVKAESLQTLNYNSRVAYSEFSISKATYDMSGISFSDANYIYDGSEKVLVISGELPQGVIVNYLPTNRMTNVGSIHVTASFEGDPINYFSIPSVQAWLVIEKAVNNLSASIDDIVYGQNLDIRVTNPNGGSLLFNFKPQDADDEAYTDAKPVNAGLYTAKIYSAATENYTEAYYLVDFEIRKAVLNIGNVTFEDAEFEYDGTEKFISVSGVLPAGVNAYYENRSRTEVGSQTATVELRPLSGADNYIPLEPLTATLTIRKAANNLIVRVSDVFINDELDIEVINPTGGTLTYLYKAQGAGDFTSVAPTAPGAYILKVISAETDNYVEAEREVSFNINKFNYDMTGVQFTNATYVYDGTEKTLTISGDLPEGVSVSYSANTLVNAGSLEVVATFTGDNSLYNPITPKVATLAIHKAVIDMTGVTFADKRVPYDGYRKSLVITGTLPEGVTVTYLNNTLTKVGTVVATAQFNHNSPNHEPIPSLTASLSVQRGTYNMSGVTFEDATYIYDGQVKIITVKGKLPEGVSVSYSSNALMHPGRVVATARFVGDSENYEPIPHMTATLTVEEYVPLVSMVKSAEIQKITSKDNTITAILANDAQSFTLGLQVKDNAEYKLYTDEACTQELENGALTLQEGSQIVYVKVTMADGSEQVVKINLTRAEAPLLSPQLTLVLLGASAITIMTLLVLVLKGKKLKPKKAR